MPTVSLRLYAELNDFLAGERRGTSFDLEFVSGSTIRDIVDALAVPRAKIDLILANGRSVDLSYQVLDSDRIALYPVFEALDISTLQTVRAEPLRYPSFVLDVHLGKLAYHLRMFGFDTLYRNDYRESDLLMISTTERRILLSRAQKLLEDPSLTRVYRVLQTDPRHQLIEVLHRFDLFESIHPFTRCLLCNSRLHSVAKEVVLHRLPERIREFFSEFQFCATCDKVFWKGSHYERMNDFVREVLEEGRRH